MLQNVRIAKDSKLEIIGERAFYCIVIKSIFILSNVKLISQAFKSCSHLQNVKFAENSKLEIIGDMAFN